jgi:hypothetical protein
VNRLFLLSPARLNGQRARLLVRPNAAFELARGDIALMLRCAASGHELAYASVQGALRTGRRAPRIAAMKLPPS